MKIICVLALLVFTSISFSKEVMVDDDALKQVYDSASNLGVCATIGGLKGAADRENSQLMNQFITNFIRDSFSSSVNEWQSNCKKHIALIHLFEVGHRVNLNSE
jgi:hypothetical protein